MKPVSFLLVDDLEENLLVLEGLLRREGLQLLKAKSGDEALELLLQHDVALALVDVQMPGLDGFQLAEFMRGNERTRHVPIIFVTAGGGGQRRFRGYEAGAVDFIQKPIEPDILRSKADVFFEMYRQKQQLAVQRDELALQAEALRMAARQKDILLQEINHRIKNLFALVSGLISVSARSVDTKEELVADLRARMNALANAHALTLPDLKDDGVVERSFSVSALIEAVVLPHKTEQGSRLEITGSDITLSGNTLTSLGLLLHELTTNSAKYGALSSPKGRLVIHIETDCEMVNLHWTETGGSARQSPPERQGFGATLEKATLQGLNATLTREWKPAGLSLLLRLPMATLQGPRDRAA